jgi:hypothetical protein
VKIPAALCVLACVATPVFGQDEGELTAKARIFNAVGPGLRSVKAGDDGCFYVLAAPNDHVAVFGKDGKLLKNIPDYSSADGPASSDLRTIRFG